MFGESGQPGGLARTLSYSGEFHRDRAWLLSSSGSHRRPQSCFPGSGTAGNTSGETDPQSRTARAPRGTTTPRLPKSPAGSARLLSRPPRPPTSAARALPRARTHTPARTHGLKPREGCLLSPAPAPQGHGCSPTCSMKTTRAQKRPPGTRLGTALTGRSII